MTAKRQTDVYGRSGVTPCYIRVQLTSDGHKVYVDAVESAFGSHGSTTRCLLRSTATKIPTRAARSASSPAECTGTKIVEVSGNPNPKHIDTRLRRATEPHHADAHAPLYPPNKCLLKEGRESTLTRSRCISCITTSARFIRASASPRRWRLASRTMCGTFDEMVRLYWTKTRSTAGVP